MKKLRLYLDTSVIGGCLDKEFDVDSLKLLQEMQQGEHIAIVSSVTVAEVIQAPPKVQDILTRILGLPLSELISLPNEANDLAELYLKAKIVTKKYQEDALHIAIATVSKADILLSWNFKHIVNVRKIMLFNSVNLSQGYPLLDIRSPSEVIHD
jgi:predicted nucleic acid-binding protein